MKAIVIGRHTPSGDEGIEIVGNEDEHGQPQPRPVMFPATSEDCYEPLRDLLNEAIEMNCKLLFQAVPFQVATALHGMIEDDTRYEGCVGAIVSIPGPRLKATSQMFASDDPHAIGAIEAAVRFANGRAKIEIMDPYQIKVSVDPFSPFEFSHIQWFDGSISNMSLQGEQK